MLDKALLQALKGYTANMQQNIDFVVQAGQHDKRDELMDFLQSFASVSERIQVREADRPERLRSPLSFELDRNGEPTGIVFSGIPGGHEFNSLVLAVLHSSGTALKLDNNIKKVISNVDQSLHFEVFVSLSCHNCPDVVQALNQFATINPLVSSEMIDGGLYPDLIEQRNIQGVPSVYLNGEVFANGKIDTAQLLEKLIARYPYIVQAAQEPQPREGQEPQDEDSERLPLQDVCVVGGGPAGVSAAIYAARKGLKVTLVADRIGGQVKDTLGIENLISVSSTTGPQLSAALQAHMNDYEITLKEHLRVSRIEKGDIKRIVLTSGEVIESKTVIIASGAKWRELGVPGEQANVGNGVAYCPHCDGPFFKGKDVAVIGGGNSGIEAALDLAGIVKSVTVYEFLPDLKADQLLIDQAERTENIQIKKHVAVQEILAESGKVNALVYQQRDTGEVKQQNLEGVFVQIGLLPNSDFLKGIVELTPYGEVIINEKGETSEVGIFACGDVTTVPYKQIVISMGEGAKASLSAFDYILKSQTGEARKAA